jgi:RecG-like helicase
VALLKRNRNKAAATPDVLEPVTTPIAEAQPRQRVRICGKVTRMTARPTTGQPALAVSISDDTGSIVAVWTGRRSIGGITLGRRVMIDGVSLRRGAQLEFTNPRYTLMPR